MRIVNRIKELRERRGWTQEQLAQRAKISRSNLPRYEKGDPIAPAVQKKLAEAFGVEVGDLFGRAQELRLSATIRQYPVLAKIRAGKGTVTYESERTAEGPSGTKYEKAFYFEVTGDSMEPRWGEGDLVLTHPEIKPANGEYAVVCWHDEEGALKRVFFSGDKIILQSLKPDISPIIIDAECAWFMGKVLYTKHK